MHSPVRTITVHDARLLVRNRRFLASNMGGIGLLLLLVIGNMRRQQGEALTGMFVVALLAAALFTPMSVAAFALVGEKERRTLEPLLLTPVSVSQLIAAKATVSVVLSLGVLALVWIVALSAAALRDVSTLHFLVAPSTILISLVFAPVASAAFSLIAITVSGRAPDTQTALATCQLVVSPLILGLIALWMGAFRVTEQFFASAAGGLLLLTFLLFKLSVRMSQPEVLLAKRGASRGSSRRSKPIWNAGTER